MKKIFSVVLALVVSISSFCQSGNVEYFLEDMKYLVSDDLMGRETGTEGELMAAKYIANKMQELELIPKGAKDSFFQTFTITPKVNPHGEAEVNNDQSIKVNNVVGYIDNSVNKTVVIGAHYDHLGMGGEGSLFAGKDIIHNGADDNASGVAIMLRLISELKDREDVKNSNFLFIAFSGEEKGLWGSNYFCKNPTIDLENVSYMINMDMVGRFDEAKGLAINGVGTSSNWEDVLAISNEENIPLITSESGVGPSDHTSFYLKDIPVLHFFTGQHKDYHKPSDDLEKINLEGMKLIMDYILNIIITTDKIEKFDFQKTKNESEETPRFTVTLGVMPDYLFQGSGMRIDGVTEGRPASEAGFKAGDIVIKMGEIEVIDMMTYMKALSKYKKGDKAIVIVKRGDKEIEEKVKF
jgi:hypothetical protein